MIVLMTALAGMVAAQTGEASGGQGSAEKTTYANPVINKVGLADPHVLRHQGTFYLYPTGDNRSYRVYTSTDLVHWRAGPTVFEPGGRNVWAPDVYHHPKDRRFYLYYTANERIGVAVSDRPKGPFEKVKMLFDQKPSIDAQMFRDEGGELYLYYVTLGEPFHISVQRMADPTTKKGQPKALIHPTEPWEKHWVTEAPWMLKRGDTYYLMYSASGANTRYYSIGYATSDSPMGPFEKYEGNPIVEPHEGLYGPGHHSVVRDGAGEMWMVYHQKQEPEKGWGRIICIDPLRFDDQGRLEARATRGKERAAPAPLEGN